MNLVLLVRHRRLLFRAAPATWRRRRLIVAASAALAAGLVAATVWFRKRRSTEGLQPAPDTAPRDSEGSPVADFDVVDEAGRESFPASDPPATY